MAEGTETAVEEYNRLIREREVLDRRIREVKPRASAEANAAEFKRRADREAAKAEALSRPQVAEKDDDEEALELGEDGEA